MVDRDNYILIGWIAWGMDTVKKDNYKSMFGKGVVRVPPKVYKTEAVANRYGVATPVYVKEIKNG